MIMSTKLEDFLAGDEGREEIFELIEDLDGNGLIVPDDELIKESLGLRD
jgi:hypothetical protein